MATCFYYLYLPNIQFVNLQSKIANVHDAPVSSGLGVYDKVYQAQYSEPDRMRISKTSDIRIALPHMIFSVLELGHAGADNKYESFDVWFGAKGPELIELDENF